MKLRHVAAHTSAALVVYVAFAASCYDKATDPGIAEPDDTGAGVLDALEDVLGVDVAVHDAKADDAGGPVAVACDQDFPAGHPLAGSAKWGEKAYPGRSKEDLARATVVICYGAGPSIANLPPGYFCYSSVPVVRDGALSFTCANGSTGVSLTVPPPI